jgi:hypothetical protein
LLEFTARRDCLNMSTRGNGEGTFITTNPGAKVDMSGQRRSEILKLAGAIESHTKEKGKLEGESLNELARKLELERSQQVERQPSTRLLEVSANAGVLSSNTSASNRLRPRGRRGSTQGNRRGSTGRRKVGLSKQHVKKWNKQFDRDDPPKGIVSALRATGHINLKELAEVGGEDLIGYPRGNDPGDTKSFMLLLS